jgi:aerobic-type carbon monoxide dehydrogenase small subunit (CoxS/CutS family)
MITLHVNGAPVEVDVPPETPLLWALREQLGLTGTKFGCGAALCGACTVHVAGAPVRSCVTPVSGAVGHAVTTIEGVRRTDATTEGTPAIAEAVQAAWVARSVAQCGYCQPGMVMTAVQWSPVPLRQLPAAARGRARRGTRTARTLMDGRCERPRACPDLGVRGQ